MKKLFFFFAVVLALSANAQRTPTMGWSSWNTFALNINEDLIRQQADAMHNTGLQKAGFKYVNIDDGYWDGSHGRGIRAAGRPARGGDDRRQMEEISVWTGAA